VFNLRSLKYIITYSIRCDENSGRLNIIAIVGLHYTYYVFSSITILYDIILYYVYTRPRQRWWWCPAFVYKTVYNTSHDSVYWILIIILYASSGNPVPVVAAAAWWSTGNVVREHYNNNNNIECCAHYHRRIGSFIDIW